MWSFSVPAQVPPSVKWIVKISMKSFWWIPKSSESLVLLKEKIDRRWTDALNPKILASNKHRVFIIYKESAIFTNTLAVLCLAIGHCAFSIYSSMRREEKRRKFHEAVVSTLFPPPPSPPPQVLSLPDLFFFSLFIFLYRSIIELFWLIQEVQDNEPANKLDEGFDVVLINPGLSLDIAFFFSNGTEPI